MAAIFVKRLLLFLTRGVKNECCDNCKTSLEFEEYFKKESEQR